MGVINITKKQFQNNGTVRVELEFDEEGLDAFYGAMNPEFGNPNYNRMTKITEDLINICSELEKKNGTER